MATHAVEPPRAVWNGALVQINPLKPLSENIFTGHDATSTAKNALATPSHHRTSSNRP
jgi:hypothetical protein